MKTSAPILLLLAGTAAAYDFTNWQPAGPEDSRSPCPVLNALANHNILPHSGRGLTVPLLVNTLGSALSIGPDLSTILAIGGLLTSPNPLSLHFDLSDLDSHNAIEHDASLGHNDYNLSPTHDNHSFNQTLFDGYLSTAYNGSAWTSLQGAAKGRLMRVNTEAARDPEFTYGPKQAIISYGESALVLSMLGDPVDGVVPTDWLKVVWEQERLPYNEGWRTVNSSINGVSVNLMIPRMVALGGEALPEGTLVVENTLLRALAGLDPMGVLGALEEKVLGLFNVTL